MARGTEEANFQFKLILINVSLKQIVDSIIGKPSRMFITTWVCESVFACNLHQGHIF